MIHNSRLILGPPGCGKTYTLIGLVKDALQRGIHPSRIGVVSFTTKAIGEFVTRSCVEFKLDRKDFPHFKTLHATGYHGLGLQTTDVMGRDDYNKAGDMLGVDFYGADAVSPHDGVLLPSIGGSGSKYLQMIMRASYRQVSLDEEYNYTGDRNLFFDKLVHIDRQLTRYKEENLKFDFCDMIKKYPELVAPPSLDMLIVDEAQDLTPLQWSMVSFMADNSEETIIAGDDDQAIHRWTGVDVHRLMEVSDRVDVLKQSYRLPHAVWSLATRISRRIPDRMEKEFFPREEDGNVTRVFSLRSVPLHEGSWTLMARTNGYAQDMADQLREWGYYFSVKGKTSISRETLDVMSVWKDLQEGKAVGISRLTSFYKGVSKTGEDAVVKRGSIKLFDATAPDDLLTYDKLVSQYGLLAPLTRNAASIARLSEEERLYIRAIERRGESIEDEPRIKLSTIHAMKGGEDDNVAVYTGSTKACLEGKHPEDEHRIFYVAVTRAKENLYIIESDKKYRYMI